jgi:hypothetical protein
MHRSQALSAALVAVILVMAAGCGLVDFKYEEAEIRDVVKGIVPSPSERYRVPLPEIPILRKNIGIVRQDGLFVPIVGPDLKAALAAHTGRNVELGVHFRREPRRHLVLERIWAGDEEIRLVENGEDFRYRLPDFVDASDIEFDRFDQEFGLCEVGPQEQTKLASAEHKKIYISEFNVRKADVPETLVANELVVASGRPTNRPQYFLTSRGSDYLVTSRDPMIYLMLDYLLQEEREFRGGIEVGGIFDRNDRISTRVAGTADIKWIALGGPLYVRAS